MSVCPLILACGCPQADPSAAQPGPCSCPQGLPSRCIPCPPPAGSCPGHGGLALSVSLCPSLTCFLHGMCTSDMVTRVISVCLCCGHTIDAQPMLEPAGGWDYARTGRWLREGLAGLGPDRQEEERPAAPIGGAWLPSTKTGEEAVRRGRSCPGHRALIETRPEHDPTLPCILLLIGALQEGRLRLIKKPS